MTRSADEPFTLYGLIARSIETDDARDRVVFHLDPRAHFSDGAQITAADVLFTFNLLEGQRAARSNAPPIALSNRSTRPTTKTVRFDLTGADDRELPLMLALMPVLSRAHTDAAHFEDQTLADSRRLRSLPRRRGQPGQRLVLRRDPNYWARDLPITRGLYNFDEIRIDYYRDASAMFEAFKAGLYDFRVEDDPTRWLQRLRLSRRARRARPRATRSRSACPRACPASPSTPAARSSPTRGCARPWRRCSISNGSTPTSTPASTSARAASSTTANSSSAGRPASAQERALLAPVPRRRARGHPGGASGRRRSPTVRGATARWRVAPSICSGKPATRLRGGALSNARGEPLAFEILVKTRQEERLALAYSRSLGPHRRRRERAPRRRSAISAPPRATSTST